MGNRRKLTAKILINSIIFNLIETIVIFAIGFHVIRLNILEMCKVSILFFISRMIFGGASHYKSPFKCFIVSLSLLSSIFLLYKHDCVLGNLAAMFSGLLLTEKGDVTCLYQWSGKQTQYQDIIDYIKFNPFDNKIKEFEEKIQEQDMLSYLIYKYRFKDNLTFANISDRLDIETNRITEIQDKVAFTFRVFIGL